MKEIANILEYTKLGPTTTDNDIVNLCNNAIDYKISKICIAPNKVEFATNYLAAIGANDTITVAVVIGYPHGTHMVDTKMAELELVTAFGVREFDIVVDISSILEQDAGKLSKELKRYSSHSGLTLKAIVEAPLLSNKQLDLATKVVANSDFQYIKTSTGLIEAPAIAAARHIRHILDQIGDQRLLIKASGGISTEKQVIELMEVDPKIRIGTSKAVQILSPVVENQ